jgi:hypothetical protein
VFAREVRYLVQHALLRGDGDQLSKPPSLEFQMPHLLAFLLLDVATLTDQLRALGSRGVPDDAATTAPVRLRGMADVDALLAADAATRSGVVPVDVGTGLDGESTTRLALAAAAGQGPALEVRDDGRRSLRQYESVRTELPPSMLWVRIAIRAAQAGRGEQQLAV